MLMSNGLSHPFNYKYFEYNLNRAFAVYIILIPQHHFVVITLSLTYLPTEYNENSAPLLVN